MLDSVSDLEIYNPWSIIKCLDKYEVSKEITKENIESKILQSYWEHSGNVDFILRLLKNELVKKYIELLIAKKPITFDLKRHITMSNFEELRNMTKLGSNYRVTSGGINLLFSYLFFGGYLTVYELPALFMLPNKEVRKEMAERLLEYYQAEYTVDEGLFKNVTDRVQIILDSRLKSSHLDDFIEDFRLALEILLKALPRFGRFDAKQLANEQDSTVSRSEGKIFTQDLDSSSREVLYHGNEDLVHCLLNYIVLQVTTITRFATEVSVGSGKADVAFIDEKNGCAAIIELKYNQTADIALQQIHDRAYARDIIGLYNTILFGVNILPDKRVQVKHRVILKEANT